jgi:membrane-associated phospholipid phosphatase
VSEEARRPWVTVATYGTAGAVAWSRVYEDKHWTSDVVAGSLVGIVAGRGTVAYLHRRAERRAGGDGDGAGSGARVSLLPGGVAVSIPAP